MIYLQLKLSLLHKCMHITHKILILIYFRSNYFSNVYYRKDVFFYLISQNYWNKEQWCQKLKCIRSHNFILIKTYLHIKFTHKNRLIIEQVNCFFFLYLPVSHLKFKFLNTHFQFKQLALLNNIFDSFTSKMVKMYANF